MKIHDNNEWIGDGHVETDEQWLGKLLKSNENNAAKTENDMNI